jgi:hypothetical protein
MAKMEDAQVAMAQDISGWYANDYVSSQQWFLRHSVANRMQARIFKATPFGNLKTN